ncbi:MAG: A24 family peptidase [Patescibacteria group bacterium]
MEAVYVISTVAGLLGLVMGSFAGASVWRLRARQLVRDRTEFARLKKKRTTADGLTDEEAENYNFLQSSAKQSQVELKRIERLTKTSVKNDRSQCLECGHELKWYDLLPIASWLSTKGKCRYCKKPIGSFEPIMELGTAATFAIFAFGWVSTVGLQPFGLLLLGLWLVALTMLVILFAYDLKWYLLPDVITFPLIGLSAVITALTVVGLQGIELPALLISAVLSVLILAGLYFVLWFISKGAWVGFGDVKLGVALGLLIADWKLALLTLFLANLIGTLIVLPGLVTGTLSRKAQVPFGPLLIVGFFISVVAGNAIIGGYESFSIWLTNAMLML